MLINFAQPDFLLTHVREKLQVKHYFYELGPSSVFVMNRIIDNLGKLELAYRFKSFQAVL